ncbi:STAS domain-containing protein [Streptomyces sp. NPDC048483]|uniref:STAS domain-containing protein n=1 Tax=Streptomyces sp. NPDC048483 TaxID=3154927 RepID=UPI0034271228
MPTPYEPVVWPLTADLTRADIPPLCARLCTYLNAHPHTTVVYDARALSAPPDTTTLEALLRLQLTARRLGRTIGLCHVPRALGDVLSLTGLAMRLSANDRARPAEEGESSPD